MLAVAPCSDTEGDSGDVNKIERDATRYVTTSSLVRLSDSHPSCHLSSEVCVSHNNFTTLYQDDDIRVKAGVTC